MLTSLGFLVQDPDNGGVQFDDGLRGLETMLGGLFDGYFA